MRYSLLLMFGLAASGLKQLFTGQWAEIVGWNPTVTNSKADALNKLGKLSSKYGEGVFPDQFKLMALYGDVALATDRRTRKYTDPSVIKLLRHIADSWCL
jgi:hypothetical protein